MAYCGNCGSYLPARSAYCGNCGQLVRNESQVGVSGKSVDTLPPPPPPKTQKGKKNNEGYKESGGGNGKSSFVEGLNDYMGNTNSVNLNWKDLFTDVFKPHTTEEAENIFICGTKRTTPPLSEVSECWPKPWLYSRVFLCFVITYLLLYICSVAFKNPNAYPGLIIIGSFAVPFTTLVLFMEVNAYKNISVYDVMKFFLIGGCASLVVTLFLFDLDIVDTDLSSTWGAMMVGIIEEIGKLVIVYYLIRQLTSCNYILSALLAGACVGAGFAAFESAGYAMRPMLQISHMAGVYGVEIPRDNLMEVVTSTIYLRGILAPGGHVAWAAVTGAALVIAKGAGALTMDVFTTGRFWKIFAIPVVLHGLWDAPILDGYLKLTALIVAIWIVVLILINMGLDEVKKIKGTIS